jgi:hypothetical protein
MGVAVRSWDASRVHCGKVQQQRSLSEHGSRPSFSLSAHGSRPNFPQQRPSQQVQNTICGRIQSGSPDDGHNDARNMLRQKKNCE